MRIFLIRHGESVGNVDEKAYSDYQDHGVPLTEYGYSQAVEAGKFLKGYYDALTEDPVRIWHSSFVRTRQTTEGFLEGFGKDKVGTVREDYLLREQDFGIFSNITDPKEQKAKYPDEFEKFEHCRRQPHGRFYAKAPYGETKHCRFRQCTRCRK